MGQVSNNRKSLAIELRVFTPKQTKNNQYRAIIELDRSRHHQLWKLLPKSNLRGKWTSNLETLGELGKSAKQLADLNEQLIDAGTIIPDRRGKTLEKKVKK